MKRTTIRESESGTREVLWELRSPLTIIPWRPATIDSNAQGYSWSFAATCACGWSAELRGADSLNQALFGHRRCGTITEWHPARG